MRISRPRSEHGDKEKDEQAQAIGPGAEAGERGRDQWRDLPDLAPDQDRGTAQQRPEHDGTHTEERPDAEDRGRQHCETHGRAEEQRFQRSVHREPARRQDPSPDAGCDREHSQDERDREHMVQDQENAGVSTPPVRHRQMSGEQAAHRDESGDRRVEALHGDSSLTARASSESAAAASPRARAALAWFRRLVTHSSRHNCSA